VREALRGGGAAALRRAVANASDEDLERRFGSAAVQGAIFTAMARGFDPGVARGFEGDVVYELRWSGNGRPPGRWTLHVDGGRARVRRGAAPNAALRVTISLADFARMAAGALNPMAATLEGRTDVEGDLALALRLTEMFGGRVPY
jgi:hypothetical protein